MAVHQATRSKSPVQLRPQHTGTKRQPHQASPTPVRRTDHQLKAEIFDVLRHLNRGYGVALAAFDKLEHKDRLHGQRIFASRFLEDYRSRTEALRSETNRDLLRLLAGHEEQDAERVGRVSTPELKREEIIITN